jgi:hypothetical protein
VNQIQDLALACFKGIGFGNAHRGFNDFETTSLLFVADRDVLDLVTADALAGSQPRLPEISWLQGVFRGTALCGTLRPTKARDSRWMSVPNMVSPACFLPRWPPRLSPYTLALSLLTWEGPWQVKTLDLQAKRALAQLDRITNPLHKYVFLMALQVITQPLHST